MFQSCKSCPSHRNGRGIERDCVGCGEYNKLPPFKRSNYLSLPSEIIENLLESVPTPFLEYISMLDKEEATMLCQSLIVGMSHKEVIAYHKTERDYSQSKVQRIIARAVGNLRKLIRDAI